MECHRVQSSSFLVLQRGVITLANGLLLTVLLYHRVLRQRKQYLVIALAALADMSYGLTGATAGVQELFFQLSLSPGLFPSSQCPAQVNLFNQAAMVAQQLTLLCQCTDRLLAVSKPFYYFSLTPRYAYKMAMAIYGTVFIFLVSAEVGHFMMPVKLVHSCAGFAMFHPLPSLFLLFLMALPAMCVFCMQPALYIGYKRSFTKTRGTSVRSRQQQEYLALQRKLMVTVVLTACAAIFTVVAPALFLLPLLWYLVLEGGVGMMLSAVFYNLGPIANVAIYCARQNEVRKGLIKMFRGQQLPNNFEAKFRGGGGVQA